MWGLADGPFMEEENAEREQVGEKGVKSLLDRLTLKFLYSPKK